MSLRSRAHSLLHGVLRRGRLEQDMDEELRFHMSKYSEDLVRQGVTPAEASRRARLEFGGVEPVKEDCRQARGLRFLDESWQDLRYASRMLRKSPGFAIVAILTLALGIGANTAIFSLVDAWVLRPVPYYDAERLVSVQTSTRRGGVGASAPADVLDWQRESGGFEQLCAYSQHAFTMQRGAEPERVSGGLVNAGFFRMLGVVPQIGRDFTDADDRSGAGRVVLLTDGLWHGRFGGQTSVIGSAIQLDGESVTVIGVLPASFHLPLIGPAEIWTPLALSSADRQNRASRWLDVLGRMKPGLTTQQTAAALSAAEERHAAQFPAAERNRTVVVHTLRDEIGRQTAGNETLIVFGLVGCVLLIACANVANLIVARAVSRQKEMAVRLAIGAGRWRLWRQLLTENLVLFLIAGAVSVLFANWGVKWIADAIPAASRVWLPNMGRVRVEMSTLLYTLAVALGAGLLFGFAPAFQARRTDVDRGLKQAGRSSTGAGGTRLKNALIVTELSLALVVLIASGLLIKGLQRMYASDPGFNPSGLKTFSVTLPDAKYKDPARADAFFDDLLERLRRQAGVESVARAWSLPYDGNRSSTRFAPEDRAIPTQADAPAALFAAVTTEYFAAMEIRLLRGRVFSERDRDGSPDVVIVNQTMAQQVWPGEVPVGRRLRYGFGFRRIATVVGVVADMRGLNDLDVPEAQFFAANAQIHSHALNLMVRCRGACASVGDGIRSAVFAVDPAQPVSELRSMDEIISVRRAPNRIIVQVTGFFALLALFLAAMGTYALLAYSVAARRQEFGIRMALGAATGDLVALVMGQGIKLAAAGLAIGLIGSLAATRLLGFMLYHVSPTDPPTFAGVTLLLLAVAAVACYVPARRAARINPTQALRYD